MDYFWIVLLASSLVLAGTNRIPPYYEIGNYDISLTVPEETLTSPDINNFSGLVQITFAVTARTNNITLHASNGYLTIVNSNVAGETLNFIHTNDMLTAITTNDLEPGSTFLLIIEYEGKLSSDMTGFFKTSYVDGQDRTHYILSTQFQPTYARKAFPCFDEPSFKSTFDLTLNLPAGFKALSNTPTVATASPFVFQQIPRMSTYVLAFIIHNVDFTCSTATTTSNFPHEVCSRQNEEANRGLAAEVAPKLLEQLDLYTDIRYEAMGLNKLHHLAIPNLLAGAMENWGLVTYREEFLLWNSIESSKYFRQYATTTIAHELAHFWFGNLVTLEWWSDTYLNEGFATYFEYFITHRVFPEWQMDKQFVTDVVQAALLEDSKISSKALDSVVSTPDEIVAKFGKISYLKGAAILRMLEHIVGPTTFQNGIRKYLQNSRNGLVTLNQLLTSMEPVTNLPAGTTLSEIMENWIVNAGYPVIKVTIDGTSASITQERFLSNGTDGSTWYVPITYTASTDLSSLATLWLGPSEGLNLQLPENAIWILANHQQLGFYRVNYDEATWYKIGEALASADFGNVPEVTRAQIIDDLFNLAKYNKVSYQMLFTIIDFLRAETSYHVWLPAFSGFDYILHKIGSETQVGVRLSEHIRNLMSHLYNSSSFVDPYTDNQVQTLNQMSGINWACKLRNEECISTAKALFLTYRNFGFRPHINIRNVVYCYAIRDSTDEGDWYFLWQSYLDTVTTTEKIIILNSLGCTTNQNILNRYLGYSVTNDNVRPQDRDAIFLSALAGSSVGFETAVEFLRNNHPVIRTRYQSLNALTNLLNEISSRITTQDQYQQFKALLEGNLTMDPDEVIDILSSANENLIWKSANEFEINSYFRSRSSSVSISVLVLVTMLFPALFMI